MSNLFQGVQFILIFASPAFVLPLILGPLILRMYKEDPFSRPATWLTLKPLLATPLWAIALVLLSSTRLRDDIVQTLSLIPAIGLTAMIVWRFKDFFREITPIPFILVGMDALRWVNTFAWMRFGGMPALTDPFFMAGWILPNVYAIMAFVIVWLRSRERRLLT